MKTSCRKLALLVAVLSALSPQLPAFAQGSLTPPGAPAPTMKSLAQIEPRTPINSLPYTITNGGAYYFVTNLTLSSGNGIFVQANHVTIDLNGFALSGTGASANSGIFVPINVTNLCVRNGTVNDWHSTGVGGFRSFHGQYEKLRVVNCEIGIDTGTSCVVRDCEVSTSASFNFGIRTSTNSVIKDCMVSGYPFGIEVSEACSVISCTVRSNSIVGMDTGPYCIIKDCVIAENRLNGLQVQSNSIVSGNLVLHNNSSGADAGIFANGGGVRIEKNHVRHNVGTGIAFSGTNNIVINNSSGGNGANYSPASGPGFGPIQDPATATNPFANF